ncbi:MAG: hypothetical protein HDR44_01055 [Allobaculum sp.]|nr:hypothetical protein [Allobaculum sp.]
MALIVSPLDACRVDLFTPEDELREKYTPAIADRILRLRHIYNFWLSNPSMKDRQLRDEIISRYGISQSAAYSDISVIHQLVPLISQKSREFHRTRANEMLLETYAMAKARKDTKTMERTAATYSKVNRVDLDDEVAMPYDDIVPQNFSATLDPSVLGIKPIPDINNYISRLIKDLSRDFADIQDVEAEPVDLEENHLFAPLPDASLEPQG